MSERSRGAARASSAPALDPRLVESIVGDVRALRARLAATSDQHRYRFKAGTPVADIEEWIRQEHAIVGVPEGKIRALEERHRVRLPVSYRAFLREMGERAGTMLTGTDYVFSCLDHLQAMAPSLIAEWDVSFALSADSFVIASHQGYQFHYLRAAGEADSPVWHYLEGEEGPTEVSASFLEWLTWRVEDQERCCTGPDTDRGPIVTLKREGDRIQQSLTFYGNYRKPVIYWPPGRVVEERETSTSPRSTLWDRMTARFRRRWKRPGNAV